MNSPHPCRPNRANPPLPNEPTRAANRNYKTNPIPGDQTNPPRSVPSAAPCRTNPISLPNETCMSATSRRLSSPGMKNAALRAAAWPLEKTNPLWQPAKENKGVASRRQSIFGRSQSTATERTQRGRTPRSHPRKLQNKANPGRQRHRTNPPAATSGFLHSLLQRLPVLPLLPPANLQLDRRPLEPEAPPQLVHQVPLV